MGDFFGTDGIRGIANKQLTPELAFRLGKAAGFVLLEQQRSNADGKARVLIGKDTRLSSDMLENALAAGFMSVGIDVIKLGVIPTPGVSYLISKYGVLAGAMISASHNPYPDNGIKIFNQNGLKLAEAIEEQIEAYLKDDKQYQLLPSPTHDGIGTYYFDEKGLQIYEQHLQSTISESLQGCRIILDCANGAASELAPRIFRQLGATVSCINNNPNGTNINVECGSTHIEHLRKQVLDEQADLGFAFDGDADRLIAIDHLGNVVDGDYILTVCGRDLKQRGKLVKNTVVTTVMANMGYFVAAQDIGITTEQTKVGDKYVLEEMLLHGYTLGGEQSGHIIFLEYAKTGDGTLTALQLADLVIRTKSSLNELCQTMTKFPQLLVNVRVENKESLDNNQAIWSAVEQNEQQLGSLGRILVRPSGTEPLVRVMAEGPDEEVLQTIVKNIVAVVERELT